MKISIHKDYLNISDLHAFFCEQQWLERDDIKLDEKSLNASLWVYWGRSRL